MAPVLKTGGGTNHVSRGFESHSLLQISWVGKAGPHIKRRYTPKEGVQTVNLVVNYLAWGSTRAAHITFDHTYDPIQQS